jgi:hypothetical protein
VIEDILSRLERVRKTGTRNWIACCPAHDDRSPSMTLHESPEGHILGHCFSGCSFEEIVGAVGLGWGPWFPPNQNPHEHKTYRRPYPVADVFEAVVRESLIVSLIAGDMQAKRDIPEDDFKRLMVARDRLEKAWSVANGESATRR